MGITRIRGNQIKDRSIEGLQIKQDALSNEHLAPDAAIDESKINIDWAAHGTEILTNKKLVDFVQVNGTEVGGKSVVDITSVIPSDVPFVKSSSTDEGVIVDAPKNKAIIREAITGESILANIDGSMDLIGEVYGRVDFNEAEGNYQLSFFFESIDGTETPYTMEEGKVIDWQYLKRFNLETIDEMFAANEKFVEGAADVTAHLNIEQLAKDLYGGDYTLDRDGNKNLSTSLVDQIAEEKERAANAEAGLQANIDSEAQARKEADDLIKSDLASNAVSKGASLVGINDANNKIEATTVEGALLELEGRITGVEGGGSTTQKEVDDARVSDITGEHASLDQRIEAGEARFEAVKTEVEAARKSKAKTKDFASVEARLEEIEQDQIAEVKARDLADKAVEAKITQEVANREAAIQEIEGKLAKEATDRGEAIDAVEAAIAKEVTDRESAVAGIDAKLTQEVTDRKQAIETVETAIAKEVTDRETAIQGVEATVAQEVTDRKQAIETVEAKLTQEVTDRTKAVEVVEAKLTQEVTDREVAIQAHKDELASIAEGQGGATKVGVSADAGLKATTVEGVLKDLEGRLTNQEQNGGQEVTDTHTRDAESANKFFAAKTVASLEERLVDIETIADGEFKKAAETTAEVVEARGTAANLNERLSVELNADGKLKVADQIHTHEKYSFVVDTVTSTVSMPADKFFKANGMDLDVYVNGILQANGINFTENKDVDGKGISITFADNDTLLVSDVVVLKYISYYA